MCALARLYLRQIIVRNFQAQRQIFLGHLVISPEVPKRLVQHKTAFDEQRLGRGVSSHRQSNIRAIATAIRVTSISSNSVFGFLKARLSLPQVCRLAFLTDCRPWLGMVLSSIYFFRCPAARLLWDQYATKAKKDDFSPAYPFPGRRTRRRPGRAGTRASGAVFGELPLRRPQLAGLGTSLALSSHQPAVSISPKFAVSELISLVANLLPHCLLPRTPTGVAGRFGA